jgi:hypothetical protein
MCHLAEQSLSYVISVSQEQFHVTKVFPIFFFTVLSYNLYKMLQQEA